MKKEKENKIGKPFPIANLTRADLIGLERTDAKGKIKPVFPKSKVMKLTDAQMERIAGKLCNDYMEQLYWTSLEIIADYVINDN